MPPEETPGVRGPCGRLGCPSTPLVPIWGQGGDSTRQRESWRRAAPARRSYLGGRDLTLRPSRTWLGVRPTARGPGPGRNQGWPVRQGTQAGKEQRRDEGQCGEARGQGQGQVLGGPVQSYL